jgi:hypothetical protein
MFAVIKCNLNPGECTDFVEIIDPSKSAGKKLNSVAKTNTKGSIPCKEKNQDSIQYNAIPTQAINDRACAKPKTKPFDVKISK